MRRSTNAECAADSPDRLSGAPVRQPALVASTRLRHGARQATRPSIASKKLAGGIDVRGVEEIDPGIQRAADDRVGVGTARAGDRRIARSLRRSSSCPGDMRDTIRPVRAQITGYNIVEIPFRTAVSSVSMVSRSLV